MCYSIRALRAWLIIGLLTLAVGHPVNKQENRPKKHQEQRKQAPSPPAVPPVAAPQSKPTPQEKEYQPRNEPNKTAQIWQKAVSPETWPTWALVFVGVGAIYAALRTLGAIKRQADILERQTKATEIASEAAKASADAVKSAERPWVLATLDGRAFRPDTMNDAVIRVVCNCENYGRTPPTINALVAKMIQLDRTQTLAPEPNYSATDVQAQTSELLLAPVVLPPGGRIQRPFYLPRLGRLAVERGDAILYIYGQVLYRDAFGDEHETRFCYEFKPALGGADPAIAGFYISGPAPYNKAT